MGIFVLCSIHNYSECLKSEHKPVRISARSDFRHLGFLGHAKRSDFSVFGFVPLAFAWLATGFFGFVLTII